MGGGSRGGQSRTEGAKKTETIKKRESRHRKKEEATRRVEESSAEIEAQWDAADKDRKENDDVWLACEK